MLYKNSLTFLALLSISVLLGSLGACGQSGDTQATSDSQLVAGTPDRSAAFFDPQRLLDVRIEMPASDYEQLRFEGRSLGDQQAGCNNDFAYTLFSSTVTIDGERLEDVSIRKKGFIGSLSPNRPSFKLQFERLVSGREFESLERMTLNNNRQDPSAARQCMAYKLFRDAGLVAPRCNFARVSINGADLGIYSNVESIKEPFLRRNYANPNGNLYEAQITGFTPLSSTGFQLKTNEELNDRSDIDRVVSALQASDDNLLSLLGLSIDIDYFIDFWALEIITSHWDGHTGNRNNNFFYNDPDSDRFRFIPWGTDGAFSPRAAGNGAGSVWAIWHSSLLADRLYNLPEIRARLFTRINDYLATIYDVPELLAEVDQIQMLTDSDGDAVQVLKDYISNHPNQLRLAMNGELLDTEFVPPDAQQECDPERLAVSGEINGAIASFTFPDPETGENTTATGPVLRNAFNILGATNPETSSYIIAGNVAGRQVIAIIPIETQDIRVGEIPFHGIATTLILTDTGASGFFGFASSGSLVIEEAEDGVIRRATFSAEIGLGDGLGGVGN